MRVPCADERDFYARLADWIAAKGLRVPAGDRPRVGARARVALEFQDGGVLTGDAVVEEHVDLDTRPGVRVRFLKLDRGSLEDADEPLSPPSPPTGVRLDRTPPEDADEPLSPPSPPTGVRLDRTSPGDADEPLPPPSPPMRARGPRPSDVELAGELFGDAPAGDGALSFTASTEIAASVERRTARYRRAALLVAALAVAVALAGVAVVRLAGGPADPDAVAAAHVRAADRLLAEGRLTGKGGALERLLAARRLRPGDETTLRRLDRLADLLERLAAGALERGDLAVASIHLASARAAAPDRRSLRAIQAELDRRARGSGAR